MSAQEEKTLFEEYHNGSEEAFDKLFKSNLRLVKKYASYYSKFMTFDDLFQEGSMGLTKAIERFDLDLGYKFSTYAFWWIKQAITRFIKNNQTTIRKPVHVHELSKKIAHVTENYFAIHGKEASEEEIAELVGCDVIQVRAALNPQNDVISLNVGVGEDETSELGDFVKDENVDLEASAEQEDLKRLIQKLLNESYLNDQQKAVLIYRFGIYDDRRRTLEEVGELLGITRERVRQLEKKALEKIRNNDDSDSLADFTENPDKSREFLEESRAGKSRSNSKMLKWVISENKALENHALEYVAIKKSNLKKEPPKSAPKSTLSSEPQEKGTIDFGKKPVDFSEMSFGLGNIENKPKPKRPGPKRTIKYNSFNVPSIDVLASSEDKKDKSELISESVVEISQDVINKIQAEQLSEKSVSEIIDEIEIDSSKKVTKIGPGKEVYEVKDKHIYKYLGATEEYKYIVIALLNNIPTDDLKIIRTYCGKLFDGVNASTVADKIKLRFRRQIIPRMKEAYERLKILPKCSKEYTNCLVEFRTTYNKYSIISSESLIRYLNVTTEKKYILKDLLSQLFITDLEIIRKRYGDKLDGLNSKDLTDYEKNRLLKIILPNLREYFSSLYLLRSNSEKYKNKLQEFKKLWGKRRAPSNYIFNYFDIPSNKRYVLLDLINNLSPSDFEIMKANCGNNFDGKSLRKITGSERNRIFQVILPRLAIYYELLVNVAREDKNYNEILMNFYKICNEQDINHLTANIFVYLNIPDDKKEIFFDIVTLFNKEEQGLLKENCGKNYDGIGGNILAESKRQKLYSMISKIKEEMHILVKLNRNSIEYKLELANFRRRLNIYRPINKNSLLEVLNVAPENRKILDDLLKLLPSYDLEIVIKKYGQNLDGKETHEINEFEQNRIEKNILPDLQKYYNELLLLKSDSEIYNKKIEEIRKFFESKKIKSKYLFYYLEVPFDKRDIMLDLISRLPKNDYSILQKNCGEKFDGNNIKNLDSYERNHLFQTIFPKLIKYYKMIEGLERESKEYKEILDEFKMKNYAFNIVPLNLFDILKLQEDKKDVLLDLLSIFNDKDRSTIKDYCGEEYKGNGALNNNVYIRNKILKVFIPYLQNWLNEIYNLERNSDEYHKKLEELKNKYGNIYHSNKNRIYEYFGVPKEKENVLLDLLWLLPDEVVDILKIYFGDDLNHERIKALSTEHRDKLYSAIIPKVQKFYKKIVVFPRNSNEYNKLLEEFFVFYAENKRNTARNLIKYFGNRYNFEELASAIAKINSDELRNIIYRACGPKLNGVGGERLPTVQCAVFSRDAIIELKKILEKEEKNEQGASLIDVSYIEDTNQLKENKNSPKRKGLLEYFDVPQTNIGIMLDLLTCLDSDDYSLVEKFFGNNLDSKIKDELSKSELNRLYNVILVRISKGYKKLILVKDNLEKYMATLVDLHEQWKKRRRLDNLVGYFENLYTVEELKVAMENGLFQDQIDVIYRICGINLDGVTNSSPTKKDRSKLGTIIAPKLKNELQKLYPGRKVEFDTGTLNINNSVSLTSAFVKDEPLYVSTSKKTTSVAQNVILSEQNVDLVSDEKGFTKEDYNFVYNIINSEEFKEILKLRLPVEEVLVATLIFHGYHGKTFSVNEAAEFLNTTPEDIIAVSRKVLDTYKEFVASRLGMHEESLQEQVQIAQKLIKENK